MGVHIDRREYLKVVGGTAVGAGIGPTNGDGTARLGRTRNSDSVAVETGTWPSYKVDPANTGSHPATTGPTENVSEDWRFEGDGFITSSPAVIDGAAYIGSSEGSVYALDTATGTVRDGWPFEAGGGVAGTPAITDGTAYVGSRDGTVYALDADAGAEEWTFETGGEITGAPTVVDGTVYVGSTELDGAIYALDAETGNLRTGWPYQGTVPRGSTPAVADGLVYVTGVVTGTPHLHAVNVESGSREWEYRVPAREASPPDPTSPAVSGGTVFFGSKNNSLYAVDAETGEQEWEFRRREPIQSSPAVADGIVYAGFQNWYLYAVDAAKGTEIWRTELADAYTLSAPTVVDGTVYVSTADRTMLAFDAETKEEEWCAEFDNGDSGLNAATVVDGRVYVGSRDDTVRALEGDTDGGTTGNEPPEAAIEVDPGDPLVGQAVTLDASGSTDPDGAIQDYEWDLDGDGAVETRGVSVTHTFEEAGDHDVRLLVRDAGGATATTRQTVPVGEASAIEFGSVSITPLAPREGEHPILSVTVENAESVSVDVSVDGERVAEPIPLSKTAEDRWRSRIDLDPPPEPGAFVHLEVVATNPGGTERLGGYDSEFVQGVPGLSYTVVEEVREVDVVVARFQDESLEGHFADPETLRRWQRGLAINVNHYFPDQSMGMVGYDLTFHDNDGKLYELAPRTEYHGLAEVSWWEEIGDFIDDLEEAVPAELDGAAWIAAHPGPTLGGEAPKYVDSEHPLKGRANDVIYVAADSPRASWLHELGHEVGLYDLYEVGNVREALMGTTKGLDDPITVAGRTGRNNNHIHTFPPPTTTQVGSVDWLEVDATAYEELPVERQVRWLPHLSSDDDVPAVEVRDTEFLLEDRGVGSRVRIYRVEDTLVDIPFSIDVVDRLETGDTTREKVGVLSPAYVEFEVRGRDTDRKQSRVAVRQSTGRGRLVSTLGGMVRLGQTPAAQLEDDPGLTVPTLDLAAVDGQGRRVGLNDEGQYVVEIPGAAASGRRIRGVEWISVPADADVEFTVSRTAVDQFVREVTGKGEHDAAAPGVSPTELRDEIEAAFRTSITEYGPDATAVTRAGIPWATDTEVRVGEGTIERGERHRVDPDSSIQPEDLASGGSAPWAAAEPLVIAAAAGSALALGMLYHLYRRADHEDGAG